MASNPEPAFVWDASDDESLAKTGDGLRESIAAKPLGGRDRGLLAVFAGLYAAWSIAWVLAIVAAPPQPASSLLDAVMYQFGEFLALIACPLWFGVVWWRTRDSSVLIRVSFLVLGLVVLAPVALVLPLLRIS